MCTYSVNNQQCWLNTKYVHIFCKQSAMLIEYKICAHIQKQSSNADWIKNMCTYSVNNQQCWLNKKYVHIFLKQSAMLIEYKICAHIL